jgi:hypothetical protein
MHTVCTKNFVSNSKSCTLNCGQQVLVHGKNGPGNYDDDFKGHSLVDKHVL